MERIPAGNVEMAGPQEVIHPIAYEFYALIGDEIRIVEEATSEV